MMGSPVQALCAVFLAILIYGSSAANRGRVHKVSDPTSITLPLNDETALTCEMNLAPDLFQWRFYPLNRADATNPHVLIDLSKARYVDIPAENFSSEKKKSTLTIKMMNYSMAGDYQCLAHYGASVIASIPDRITVTALENFPRQDSVYVTVITGNTVMWKCDPPYSNPPAYIDYSKNGVYVPPDPESNPNTLILTNVTQAHSGTYKCKATNTLLQKKVESGNSLFLKVVRSGAGEAPRFVAQPKSNYTVELGDKVFLECSAVGNPVPKVTWKKLNGELHASRMKMSFGGLQISNVQPSDEGVYQCTFSNNLGMVSHSITLVYNEVPKITEGPRSTEIKEGENLDLECTAAGTPKPQISWLLNGRTVLNDKQIESIGNQIYFVPFEKRHAGIIQCFATNSVGMTYGTADLNVIPKQISSSDVIEDTPVMHNGANHKRRKQKNKSKHKGTAEMIPPNKPTISRLNDESVMVRWSVPHNNGLPIQFFKVQYRELGPSNGDDLGKSRSSRWKTTNQDIAPNIHSYEVNNLKPDHIYKFRIAAVYTNNDNKLSPKSDKFHLVKEDFNSKNPLPIPVLTHTETLNSTSIRIFWEYTQNPNVTVDGFFINYVPASSARDYTKETVDGEKTNFFVITHLQPDTLYDIKMQSFNMKSASEFSQILKQKTDKATTESPKVTTTVKSEEPSEENLTDSKLYIFIGAGGAVIALILSGVIFLIVCIKKGSKTNDKPAVEEINHHIQAESNDYIVNPKNMPRNNGCALPPNRITITPNPLADADNKSQNMIEMSCLSNNNTASTASTQDTPRTEQSVVIKGKHKNHDGKRRKHNVEPTPSENYV